VLWLIPGGSAAQIAIAAAALIDPALRTNLVISLTDERYGLIDHPASNWRQLLTSGFNLHGATLNPVLKGHDLETSVADFNTFLNTWLKRASYKVGLFGIGADGHTAGLLPHSSALSSSALAASYQAPDFLRITMTQAAIIRLDEAFVFAVGPAKWPALKQLKTTCAPIDQPAQILKKIKKLTIITDYTNS
jgi:6-phosphogluconolactonase/glucosamine-6-phosphate isomerase/deaminase